MKLQRASTRIAEEVRWGNVRNGLEPRKDLQLRTAQVLTGAKRDGPRRFVVGNRASLCDALSGRLRGLQYRCGTPHVCPAVRIRLATRRRSWRSRSRGGSIGDLRHRAPPSIHATPVNSESEGSIRCVIRPSWLRESRLDLQFQRSGGRDPQPSPRCNKGVQIMTCARGNVGARLRPVPHSSALSSNGLDRSVWQENCGLSA